MRNARANVGALHFDFDVEVLEGVVNDLGVGFDVTGIGLVLLLIEQIDAWELPVRITSSSQGRVILVSGQFLSSILETGQPGWLDRSAMVFDGHAFIELKISLSGGSLGFQGRQFGLFVAFSLLK